MKPTYSLRSICQECNNTHIHNDFVISSINLDDEKILKQNFLDLKLNRIKCPFCKTEYTFETNIVVFSPCRRFAVKVNPETHNYSDFKSDSVPEFIFPKGFRFREVTFQIEAIEKSRIFIDNLDDLCVEMLKHNFFGDKDTLPFDEVNMIYTSCDKEYLYFTKYDYNNRILDKYRIPASLYDDNNRKIKSLSNNTWHRVNRTTIHQYISK